MLVTPVAVEVAPADPPGELRATMLEACSAAAKPASCEATESLPRESVEASEGVDLLARVVWEEPTRVRISVGYRDDQGTEWKHQQLEFSEDDPVVERWQAAGYAVGTLVVRQTPEQADEPVASETASPPEDEPEPSSRRAPPRRLLLDTAFAGGTGLEGRGRLGANGGLQLRGFGGWVVGMRGGVTWGAAVPTVLEPDGASVRARWWSIGGFVGMAFVWSSSELALMLGPVVEGMDVDVSVAPQGQERALGGVLGTVEYRVNFLGRFSAFAGLDVGSRFGQTSVQVDEMVWAHLPPLITTGRIGLSFDLWKATPASSQYEHKSGQSTQ